MTTPIARCDKLDLYRALKRLVPAVPLDGQTRSLVAGIVHRRAREPLPSKAKLRWQHTLMRDGRQLRDDMDAVIRQGSPPATVRLLKLAYVDYAPKKETLPRFVLDFVLGDTDRQEKLLSVTHEVNKVNHPELKKEYFAYLDRQALKGRKMDEFSFAPDMAKPGEAPEPVVEPEESEETQAENRELLRQVRQFCQNASNTHVALSHPRVMPSLEVRLDLTPFGRPRALKVRNNIIRRRLRSLKTAIMKLEPVTRQHFDYLEGLCDKSVFDEAVVVSASDKFTKEQIATKVLRNLRVFMRKTYYIDQDGKFHMSRLCGWNDQVSPELAKLYEKVKEHA